LGRPRFFRVISTGGSTVSILVSSLLISFNVSESIETDRGLPLRFGIDAGAGAGAGASTSISFDFIYIN